MDIKDNKLIVVLGMHRSGTSAITRGLQVMGVGLGDRVMSPVIDINPKGFWEDIDLNALNIEMLSTIGNDWHHVAEIDSIDIEILRKKGYFLRAAELLRQKLDSTPIFGFKDPRVAKLLPFWKGIFRDYQFDVTYLLAVRHPLSVVKSLAKRDCFEAEQSYLLWLGHVIMSLTGSADSKRVLVDYDRLMQAPDHELQRVAKYTGLEIDPAELQSYKNEFLDQSLRHTVYQLSDLLLDNACPPIVREVYSALLDVASEKIQLDDMELQNKIVHWVDEFENLKLPLLLVDKLLVQMKLTKQTITDQSNHVREIERDWAARGEVITNLERHVREIGADWAARGEVIAHLERHVQEIETDRAARVEVVTNLERALADQANHIHTIEVALIKFQNSLYGKCMNSLSRLFPFIRSKRTLS
jgi:O-antigen biosynthesis protein